MRLRSKWSWAIGLTAVTLATAWVARPWLEEQGMDLGPVGQYLPPAPWVLPGAQPAAPVAVASVPETPAMTPDQVRNRLFHDGSFVGTEPAGDWCVDAQQQLQPCEALRQRIEYYLLGLGEVGIADIRVLIEDEARKAHGPVLAGQIMALFDKYWQIRTYDWKSHFVQSDRSTWMPVFEEQRSVRRQILGQPWADAFFHEEETHFQTYYAQLESGQAAPPDPGEPVPSMAPGKDTQALRADRVAKYGEEAADRLAKVDADWGDWDKRITAARVEQSRLQTAPNLSDLQRQQEMWRYVEDNFKDNERIRVKALLKL